MNAASQKTVRRLPTLDILTKLGPFRILMRVGSIEMKLVSRVHSKRERSDASLLQVFVVIKAFWRIAKKVRAEIRSPIPKQAARAPSRRGKGDYGHDDRKGGVLELSPIGVLRR